IALCVILLSRVLMFCFFNYMATTEFYTLSLHDSLPIYSADAYGQRLGRFARLGGLAGALALWLVDQQVIDVGGQVGVDDEARIRLLQRDGANRQPLGMVVLQALQLQSLPFEEVAILDGVQGVQLGDLGGTVHLES